MTSGPRSGSRLGAIRVVVVESPDLAAPLVGALDAADVGAWVWVEAENCLYWSPLIPNLLGWGGERRYLVLAQDPAELRPNGGYTGTYGIVTFKNGELASHDFTDVYALDQKPGLPFVELRRHRCDEVRPVS